MATCEREYLTAVLERTGADSFLRAVVAHIGPVNVSLLAGTSHCAGAVLRAGERGQPTAGSVRGLSDLATELAAAWQVRGLRTTVTEACIGPFTAIQSALGILRAGLSDAVIIACVDLCNSTYEKTAMALGDVTGTPETRRLAAFDRRRTGEHVVPGTGCLLLSSRPLPRHLLAQHGHAVAPVGRVLSAAIARACDAIGPDRSGRALATATGRCLKLAQLDANDIDVVLSGASGLVEGDEAEARGLSQALGARDIPVIAPKAAWGSALSAAGIHLVAASPAIHAGRYRPEQNVPELRESWDSLCHADACLPCRSGAKTLVTTVGYAGSAAAVLLESPHEL